MKKKKSFYLFLVIVLAGLLIASCAPAAVLDKIETETADAEEAAENEAMVEAQPADESELMVFIDDMGNVLEFTEYPMAIVSISPSMTEMVFALGGADQIVGRDEMSLFPKEALEVTSIGALWGELPVESILALEPDLVLAAEIISAESITALQALGLQVYWQKNPAAFEDLYENLRDIAALTGNQENVEALVSDLDARVMAVDAVVTGAETTPSVFYELDATDPANPWTTGAGTFIDYMINKAGAVNAAAGVEGDYVAFSAEQLIAVNPDIILLSDALYGVTPESVAQRAGWDVILAVQSGAVFPIDPNIVSVPGPRLVDGFEVMAALIHPELFD